MPVQLDPVLKQSIAALEPVIRAHADQSERERNLAPAIVEGLIESKLFKMIVPQSLGGLEIDPVGYHLATEALARIDGSTAWCSWIPAAGSWVGVGMPDAAAVEIFADPRACVAGAIFPLGRADAVEGGFRVSARWPYASGCQHATWLGGLCTAFAGDQPRMTPLGTPEVRFVLVPAAQVQVFDTWHVNGLAGTGSHDIAIEDRLVPESHTVAVGGAGRGSHFQSPLYRFPFLSIFSTPIAAVGLGIALGAIDTALELAKKKVSAGTTVSLNQRPVFQLQMADAIAATESARSWLYGALSSQWDTVRAGEGVDLEARATTILAGAHGTRSAAQAVNLAYTAAGGTANYLSSPLQRALRDVHALTQHAGTSPHVFQSTGAILAGLPPDNPFIML